MGKLIKNWFYTSLIVFLPFFIQAQSVQKFAQLGDFKLENGKIIKDCVIGYRTCGKINSTHSNVILVITWFGGTSHDLLGFTGHGMMADSTKYFVVLIDALGNGVSSSPSNSKLQPDTSFPQFNIRDMVNSQYILAAKILGLRHVFCIMGSSMGGMQTFQWVVSYPDFMDKAIAIVGSPKLTSNDLLLWNAELLAIDEGLKCNSDEQSIKNTVVAIHALNLRTPDYFVGHIKPEEFPEFLKGEEDKYTKVFNTYDWASQLRAMIAQNVSAPFDNDMEKAAEKVKAEVLIVVSKQDHMVNPQPALDFAKLIKSKPLELDNDCGHFGAGCEAEKVNKTINNFLDFQSKEEEESIIDSSYANPYYLQRMEFFKQLPPVKHAVVFLGNSITERGEWHELIPEEVVLNRGIGGDNTFGVLARLDDILNNDPAKIFLLIGINDIGRGLPVDIILQNYERIINKIQSLSPKTILYLQSVLPINDEVLQYSYMKNKNEQVNKLNEGILKLAQKYGNLPNESIRTSLRDNLVYINLHTVMADAAGQLKKEYTIDGIHLKPLAYVQWVNLLRQEKYLK